MERSIRILRLTPLIVAGGVLLATASGPAMASNEGFATLHATINANATIGNSLGLANVVQNAGGVKTLTFTRDISTCTVIATSLGGAVPFLTLATKTATVTDVVVRTFTTAGALINKPFTIAVLCGP